MLLCVLNFPIFNDFCGWFHAMFCTLDVNVVAVDVMMFDVESLISAFNAFEGDEGTT